MMFSFSCLEYFPCPILQALLNCLTILVKQFHDTSFTNRSFWFCPPFEEFLQKDINVQEEDVIYNWMDMSSMMMSKVGQPFWVAKEMHSFMLQALIGVCSKVGSFVTNLSASTCLHSSFFISKIPTFLLVPFFIITSICAIGNNIRACHTLHCHILALKLFNIDIFTEVLEPLVKVPTLQ